MIDHETTLFRKTYLNYMLVMWIDDSGPAIWRGAIGKPLTGEIIYQSENFPSQTKLEKHLKDWAKANFDGIKLPVPDLGQLSDWERKFFREQWEDLVTFTHGIPSNFHKSDCYELESCPNIQGEKLDNAGVEGELAIVLVRGDMMLRVNLANLIALARFARI
jgi:hypothetical protein